MKFGSVAWGWTPVPEDMPSGDSLERIADKVKGLGFDIVDYLCTYESLDEYFDDDTCKRIESYVQSIGLEIGGFVFQSSAWNNPDKAITDQQFLYLEKCFKAANILGAKTISCILPQPFGAKYNLRPSPSDKIASNLPADYNFQKDWELFAGNIKKATILANKYGLKIAVECFAGTLCSTPHAMLDLLRDVNEPNFGIQLDSAHLMAQNIDIETSIYMLGGKNIFNVHAKDSDGLTRLNLAPGCGLVDYKAMLKALKNVGYNGNISVEVEFSTDPQTYMKQGLDYMKMIAKQVY